MQLESEEPTSRGFATLSPTIEHLMLVDAPIVRHNQWRRIHERDTCAVTLSGMQEVAKRHYRAWHQLHESVVRNQFGERLFEIDLNMLGIVIFERPVTGAMKMNDDRHYLTEAQPGFTATLSRIVRYQLPFKFWLKLLAKVINFTEHVGE